MNLRQNGFVLVLLTVLIGIVGDWTADPGAARLWCLPAALLLLGLSYEALMTRRTGLSLRLALGGRWRLARPVHFTLSLRQRWRRILTLELAPQSPDGIETDRCVRTVSVAADTPTMIELRGVPRRLGDFPWPPQNARLSGALGLAWWPLQLRDVQSVRVIPDIVEHQRRETGVIAAGARSSARIGSGAQMLQLRNYQPGDSLRVVDWKSSARRRQLISRDFSEDQHLDIVVGIDVGRGSGIWCGELDRLGHYINVTARFAQYAIAQDNQVGLVLFADRPLAAVPPGRGTAAVSRIRRVLQAVQLQSTDSNPIHASARIRSLVRQRSLVILLTDIDDATSGSQLVDAVRLLQPKHLPFVAGIASPALQEFARAPARDELDPYYALAAEEHRAQQQRSLKVLHGLGVPALVARPEQLERSILDAYENFRRRRRV